MNSPPHCLFWSTFIVQCCSACHCPFSYNHTLHGISCNVGFPGSLEDGVAQGSFSNRPDSSSIVHVTYVMSLGSLLPGISWPSPLAHFHLDFPFLSSGGPPSCLIFDFTQQFLLGILPRKRELWLDWLKGFCVPDSTFCRTRQKHFSFTWDGAGQASPCFSCCSQTGYSSQSMSAGSFGVLCPLVHHQLCYFYTEITTIKGLSLLLVCSHLLIFWDLWEQLSFIVSVAHGLLSLVSALPVYTWIVEIQELCHHVSRIDSLCYLSLT